MHGSARSLASPLSHPAATVGLSTTLLQITNSLLGLAYQTLVWKLGTAAAGKLSQLSVGSRLTFRMQ